MGFRAQTATELLTCGNDVNKGSDGQGHHKRKGQRNGNRSGEPTWQLPDYANGNGTSQGRWLGKKGEVT